MQIDHQTAFVSDIHLSDHDPATARFFFAAIAALRDRVSSLIVLGDLFDVWVGDDCVDATPAGELAGLTFDVFKSLGCPVYFCAGNRDFLMGVNSDGKRQTHTHGMQLLAEQTIANFNPSDEKTTKVLLCHGDEFCLDDDIYQHVRKTLRSPDWQTQFLSQSLSDRRIQAKQMRAQSQQEKSGKPSDIMDVNLTAIEQCFKTNDLHLIIHGHTHRPQQHRYGQNTRIVLPDWDAATPRGNVFFITDDLIAQVSQQSAQGHH